MWVRAIAKLMAVFAVYSIVVTRMANQSGFTETAGMLQVAAVTVTFVVIAVLVIAWRPRRRRPLDPPVE